jgi:hypothetical protein
MFGINQTLSKDTHDQMDTKWKKFDGKKVVNKIKL